MTTFNGNARKPCLYLVENLVSTIIETLTLFLFFCQVTEPNCRKQFYSAAQLAPHRNPSRSGFILVKLGEMFQMMYQRRAGDSSACAAASKRAFVAFETYF